MSQTNFICPSICIDFFVCPNGTKFACCKDGIYALTSTGKSFPEALILGSTNPQYEKRLFVDLPVLHMKTTSSEYVVYTNFFVVFRIDIQNNLCK